MTDVDLAYEQMLAREREIARPEQGTTVRYSTDHIGVVTVGTSTMAPTPAVEVDGLPATNMTGWTLEVDDIVLVTVNQGRRWVTGVQTIKGT